MNNIIITETSGNLRKLGKQALEQKWKLAILAVLIFQIGTTFPALILNQLFGKTMADMYEELYGGMYMNLSSDAAFITRANENLAKYSVLSGIYVLLVVGAFTLGLALFFLNLVRGNTVSAAQALSGFDRFFKALGLMFMQSLFAFLWGLLLIVPGIIAAIRYSQAFWILADNPEKGIMECINESKQLMKGNKSKFFCMALSFIGWGLLTGLVIGILSGIAQACLGYGTVLTFASWIFSLCTCVVSAYIWATEAVFYDILKGNLKAGTPAQR